MNWRDRRKTKYSLKEEVSNFSCHRKESPNSLNHFIAVKMKKEYIRKQHEHPKHDFNAARLLLTHLIFVEQFKDERFDITDGWYE